MSRSTIARAARQPRRESFGHHQRRSAGRGRGIHGGGEVVADVAAGLFDPPDHRRRGTFADLAGAVGGGEVDPDIRVVAEKGTKVAPATSGRAGG